MEDGLRARTPLAVDFTNLDLMKNDSTTHQTGIVNRVVPSNLRYTAVDEQFNTCDKTTVI
jgi:hypothetical protein